MQIRPDRANVRRNPVQQLPPDPLKMMSRARLAFNAYYLVCTLLVGCGHDRSQLDEDTRSILRDLKELLSRVPLE